jgi:hypothetical protein
MKKKLFSYFEMCANRANAINMLITLGDASVYFETEFPQLGLIFSIMAQINVAWAVHQGTRHGNVSTGVPHSFGGFIDFPFLLSP